MKFYNVSQNRRNIRHSGRTGNRKLLKRCSIHLNIFSVAVLPLIPKCSNNFDFWNEAPCILLHFLFRCYFFLLCMILLIPISSGFQVIYQFSYFVDKSESNLNTYDSGIWRSSKFKLWLQFTNVLSDSSV